LAKAEYDMRYTKYELSKPAAFDMRPSCDFNSVHSIMQAVFVRPNGRRLLDSQMLASRRHLPSPQ